MVLLLHNEKCIFLITVLVFREAATPSSFVLLSLPLMLKRKMKKTLTLDLTRV